MPENEYKYLDHAGLTRFKGKIQDILDTKVDKENGKYIVTVDSELSSTSTNPVRNSVVTVALNGKLGTSGDSKDNTVSFTSGDVANDAAATGWTDDVGTISSGLTHATFLNRLSLAVKNLRYLKNLLGSTDISAIGNGTVTGAIDGLNGRVKILATDESLDNIVTNGVYWARDVSSGKPDGTMGGLLVVGAFSSMFVVQTFWTYTTSFGYTRFRNNSLTWSDWTKIPTRTEIDQLNTNLTTVEYASDCNNAIDTRKFYYTNTSTANIPSSASWLYLRCFGKSEKIRAQIAMPMGTTGDIFTRGADTNGNWGSWTKMPTRAEIDQINTNLIKKNVILNNTNDLNDIQETGFYYLQNRVVNSPASWSWLIVTGGSGIGQIVYNENSIYTRAFTGAPLTWSEWIKVPSNSELKLKRYEIEFSNLSYAAGTLGSRGVQVLNDTTVPESEYIVGIYLSYISDSSRAIPYAFTTGVNTFTGKATIYLNLYRADSSAVSNFNVVVRVITAPTMNT